MNTMMCDSDTPPVNSRGDTECSNCVDGTQHVDTTVSFPVPSGARTGVDWSSEPNSSPVDCAKWSTGVDWSSKPQSFPCYLPSGACTGVDWSSEPNSSFVDCAKWSTGVDWGSKPQSFPCDLPSGACTGVDWSSEPNPPVDCAKWSTGVDWSSEPNPSPVDCAKWSTGVDWGSKPQSFPCDLPSGACTGIDLILLLWTVPSGVLVSTGVVNPNLSPVTVTVLCYIMPVMMFLTMFTLP
ncbi:hypothetical protein ACOMHN_001401 [Nucella lapillus]